MTEKTLETFDHASRLARMYAIDLGTSIPIPIRGAGDHFVIDIPEKGRIADIKEFARCVHLFGGPADEEKLDLLNYVDTSEFTDQGLAWFDPETGLSWDLAMLAHENYSVVEPSLAKTVMNAIRYAGLIGWRLPTLEELRTLSLFKFNETSYPYSEFTDGTKFWSSDVSMFGDNERAYFDVASREMGYQRYIEQERDRHTRGDGPTERARTLFVSDTGHPVT